MSSLIPLRFCAYLLTRDCVLNSGFSHRVGSILTIAAGTVFYTWVKSIEAAASPQRPAPVPKDDIEASAAQPLNREDGEVFDMQENKSHPA